jgi:hypothetical protein
MALNLVPTHWIASYSSDGTNITIPIASLSSDSQSALSSAEAHTSTGDIRKIAFEFCKLIASVYAAEATADQPQKMIVSQSTSLDTSGKRIRTVNFTFTESIATADIASE